MNSSVVRIIIHRKTVVDLLQLVNNNHYISFILLDLLSNHVKQVLLLVAAIRKSFFNFLKSILAFSFCHLNHSPA